MDDDGAPDEVSPGTDEPVVRPRWAQARPMPEPEPAPAPEPSGGPAASVEATTEQVPASAEQQTAAAPPRSAVTPWWSAAATTSVATAPPPPPAASSSPPARTAGTRSMLFAALVGAVVAALVTGVLFVAFGRDTKSSSSSDTTPLALTGSDNQGAASRGTAGGVDVRAVLARIQPAVVRIKITTADGAAAGTGIVIDPGGTIVTNAHVVSGASTIQVQLPNGDLLPATAKGVDATHDLAVINVHAHDLASATLGNSDVLQVGDPVIAVGNALDLGISVTSGIVSAIDRDVPEENGNTLLGALQTDAAINPGNSGGPLVNASGQVIGINTAIASPEESNNVGFAIAISAAKPIIADLAAGRPARDALLGVDSDPVTPDLVAQHHLRVSAGAYVTEVGSTTAAAKVGIVRGDVIVSLDGKPVTTTDELRRYVRRHRPGDKVRVVYVRADGSRHSVSVTLGSGE